MSAASLNAADPLWYKDAVVYELHVRAFADSNGDGIGDFEGMASKLDYLQSLGVTALWLLPFYPSPLRDDGYDIADYTAINPAYGDLASFRKVLREAHKRGLRVITELVINHTSDQHPWFQRARKAAPGSRWRDWYVWSDDPDRYRDARIIFEDYETSNWSWDPVAGSYYWHRFFHHQPDLNFDNPEVRTAVLKQMERWFAMGVDGMRLDAVPYLFEREGTNCENLPETHQFLKDLRSHLDERFPNRMLLAEANQWPEDAVAYFGDGDECHTSFHFPLMPRLFMALRMEDRHPLIDILEQTPDIPESCQWMIFLRNHDELTLEMVTDEERDYMYRAYAADPQMRVNLGIRRRLAPLLQNDRRRIELLNALLFSLPGTPVLYYGEELGMGDNVYLGDRDAVRTPMQWSPDRNAGFSSANPQSLYLPTIIDPEYHYESTNVEAQHHNPSSLLWWMRRIIALRQQRPVFGRGDITFLPAENAKVLAFVRSLGDEHVLVVANLSRFAQSVELDLHDHRGAVPVELFGREEFVPVGEGPYPLTLGPYGFYWFALEQERWEHPLAAGGSDGELPTVNVPDDWHDVIKGRARTSLQRALPRYLRQTRWYAGKARRLRSCTVDQAIPLRSGRGRPAAYLLLVECDYTSGDAETYVVPITVAEGDAATDVLADHHSSAIAWVSPRGGDEPVLLYDALADPALASLLIELIGRRRSRSGPDGKLNGDARRSVGRLLDDDEVDLTPRVSSAEQSNTSVMFGSELMMKVFRRVQVGRNPDLEIGRYLTDEVGFEHTAPLLGSLEYVRGRKEPRTIAVVSGFVPNEGDAWRYVLHALDLFLDEVAAEDPEEHADDGAAGPLLGDLVVLGRRVGELHLALAAGTDEAFRPERFTKLYQRSLYQSIRGELAPTLRLLRRSAGELPDDAGGLARTVLRSEERIFRHLAPVRDHTIDGMRIRNHGDLHLGQVLRAGRDFVIIDFEGEPSRSPSERRIKRSPLRDVAGMLRSFQYAGHAAVDQRAARGLHEPQEPLLRAVEAWERAASAAFLDGYLEVVGDGDLLPSDPADRQRLLSAFMLDKALYELRYELNNRPHWASIPMAGILRLLSDPPREERP